MPPTSLDLFDSAHPSQFNWLGLHVNVSCRGENTIHPCSALTTYTPLLLRGLLLPHWWSYQRLMINLPDELVHANLTMFHSLVGFPKG